MVSISRKLWNIIAIVILFIGLSVFLSSKIDVESIKLFTYSLGIWGPLFIIFGIILGGVFAPLTHIPFTLSSLYFYGFWKTFLLFYIGNILIAPSINFYIARKWGREAVRKISGKKTLNQIDKIAGIIGWKTLIVFRLSGGVLYDAISYAAGLTLLPFKTCLLITATCTIPSSLFMLFVFNKGVSLNAFYIVFYTIWSYSIGFIVPFILYKRKKRRFSK